MTIENLEALERAATAGPWYWSQWSATLRLFAASDQQLLLVRNEVRRNFDAEVVKQNHTNCDLLSEARNALPALLAVAKAAQKSLDQLSYILEVAHNEQQDEVLYPNMLSEIATRREELRAALAKLEATP